MSSSFTKSLDKFTSFSQEIEALTTLRSERRSNQGALPTVSVLVSTVRGDDLEQLLHQLLKQTLPSFELCIGLHAIDLTVSHKRLIAQLQRRKVKVSTQKFEKEKTLGIILSTLAENSSGQYIAKMDDDDYYGPEHLHDLVDAALETDADVVGRAMNYVYLEPLGVTVRRFSKSGIQAVEVWSDWVCGGTILAKRDSARAAHWFGEGFTAVDRFLLSGITNNGGKIYRTFGAGYIYRRTFTFHTYVTNYSKYLNGANEQVVGVWGHPIFGTADYPKIQTPYRFERPDQLEITKSPKLSAAVVIACRDGQEKLDLVLAGLSQQSYPSSLTHVYVIDDGSEQALTLPKLRPRNTKLIPYKNSAEKWGKTAATNDVVAKLREDVLWFIDADMIFEPDHLAHHMKWHHESDDYVVLGWKRFVESWNYSPTQLVEQLKKKGFESLHTQSWGKELWEERILRTQDLLQPGLDGYRSLVGATFSMRNKSWKALGGYDRELRTGEDTELGWRSFNSGLRILPERSAQSWHLGHSTVEVNKEKIHRHNDPALAQRIPQMHNVRSRMNTEFQVPTYEVIVDCRDTTLQQLMNMRTKLLHLPGTQARFTLLAPWHLLQERYRATEDSRADLREIWNWLQSKSEYIFMSVDEDEEITISSVIEQFEPSSIAYYLFVDGSYDIDLKDLVDYLVTCKFGLVGVANKSDQRALAILAPALARAHRSTEDTYQAIATHWGVQWITDERFAELMKGKHNRVLRLLNYLKREGKKVNSIPQLAIFIKKLVKLIIRKVVKRG